MWNANRIVLIVLRIIWNYINIFSYLPEVDFLTEEIKKPEEGIPKTSPSTPSAPETVTVGKDMVYGAIVVFLVALLTISVFTQGFGIVPCKSSTGTVCPTNTSGTTTNNSATAMIAGVPQISVGIGSLPAYGQSSAPVTWIEFSDYQCPFCQRLVYQTNANIKTNYVATGKVKMYWRDLPLSFHDKAIDMAAAARCANEQNKYWEMHDKIFEKQSSWASISKAQVKSTVKGYATDIGIDATKFETCFASNKYTSAITKDMQDASSLGVSGTPGIFVVIPKDKANYNSLKTVVAKYSQGMKLYQDSKNLIVFVGGAYPYSAFDEVLKTVKF